MSAKKNPPKEPPLSSPEMEKNPIVIRLKNDYEKVFGVPWPGPNGEEE